MGEYSFSIEVAGLAGPQTDVQRYTSDGTAVHIGKLMLGLEHRSVRIGRGAGEGVEWLGTWDWYEGERCWTTEDSESAPLLAARQRRQR